MLISDSVYIGLNEILRQCFTLNAKFDNRAYSLDFHYFNRIGKVYHENFAHLVTGDKWADAISDVMLKLNAKPVRLAIADNYDKDYDQLVELFEDTVKDLENFSVLVNGTISEAEYSEAFGDTQVKVFLEDFLANHVMLALKQANEWLVAAKRLSANEMNIHIPDYTHFIDFDRTQCDF